MGIVFLIAFFWAANTGQFEDTSTPALRILEGDEDAKQELHSF